MPHKSAQGPRFNNGSNGSRDQGNMPPRLRAASGASLPEGTSPSSSGRHHTPRSQPPPRFQRKQRPPRVQNLLDLGAASDATATLTFGQAFNWGIGTGSVASLPMATIEAASGRDPSIFESATLDVNPTPTPTQSLPHASGRVSRSSSFASLNSQSSNTPRTRLNASVLAPFSSTGTSVSPEKDESRLRSSLKKHSSNPRLSASAPRFPAPDQPLPAIPSVANVTNRVAFHTEVEVIPDQPDFIADSLTTRQDDDDWEAIANAWLGYANQEDQEFIAAANQKVIRPQPSLEAISNPIRTVRSTDSLRSNPSRPSNNLFLAAQPPYSHSRSPSPSFSGNESCESGASSSSLHRQTRMFSQELTSHPQSGHTLVTAPSVPSRQPVSQTNTTHRSSTQSIKSTNSRFSNSSMSSLTTRSTLSSGRSSLRTVESFGSLRSFASTQTGGGLVLGDSIWTVSKEEVGGNRLGFVPEEEDVQPEALKPFGAFEPTPRTSKTRALSGLGSGKLHGSFRYSQEFQEQDIPETFQSKPTPPAIEFTGATPFASVETIRPDPPRVKDEFRISSMSPTATPFVPRGKQSIHATTQPRVTPSTTSLKSSATPFVPHSSLSSSNSFGTNSSVPPSHVMIDQFAGITLEQTHTNRPNRSPRKTLPSSGGVFPSTIPYSPLPPPSSEYNDRMGNRFGAALRNTAAKMRR